MAGQRWNEPVTIESRQIGRYVTITVLKEQRIICRTSGRKRRVGRFSKLRNILMPAKEKGSVDYARSAFIAAAQEAGIFFFDPESSDAVVSIKTL